MLSDWPERLVAGAPLWLDDDDLAHELIDVAWGGRWPVVRLRGLEDRSAAEALAGRFLEVPARPLPAGSYYWHELEGLHVSDPAGTPLGDIVEVFRAGENEVYRVAGPDGDLLVPALREVVLKIDLAGGEMVVDYHDEEVR